MVVYGFVFFFVANQLIEATVERIVFRHGIAKRLRLSAKHANCLAFSLSMLNKLHSLIPDHQFKKGIVQ